MSTRYRITTTDDGRKIGEHRAVMEAHLGTRLDPSLLVHHENEIKTDNRPENLVVMTHAEHSALHNNKYPRTKICVICNVEFTPAPTKRARAQTCGSRECWYSLIAWKRWGVRR